MWTLLLFARLSAQQTLETAAKINPEDLRSETISPWNTELKALRTAFDDRADPLILFVHLDRIRRISTDELITRSERGDPSWLRLLRISRQTTDDVLYMVSHPDYKPPRGHP
jgi:hypothetical protein